MRSYAEAMGRQCLLSCMNSLREKMSPEAKQRELEKRVFRGSNIEILSNEERDRERDDVKDRGSIVAGEIALLIWERWEMRISWRKTPQMIRDEDAQIYQLIRKLFDVKPC